ncbi:hypothetical protein D3C72_1340010 [compost metagenome]
MSVSNGPEHNVIADCWRLMVFCLQRDSCNHISTNTVANQGQAFSVDANFISVLSYPAGCHISLINRNREMCFRRWRVVHKNGRRSRLINQIANEPLMRREITQDPAAAVEEHKYGQGSGRVMRLHNSQHYFFAINADCFFTDIRGGQLRPFLCVDQHLARVLRRQLLNRLPSTAVQGIQERLHVTFWLRISGKAVN